MEKFLIFDRNQRLTPLEISQFFSVFNFFFYTLEVVILTKILAKISIVILTMILAKILIVILTKILANIPT